jgi:hypothetical protein
MKRNTNSKTLTILIVGDWIIDEFWFVTQHSSDISSHVGFSHFRLAVNRGEKIINLCGAGHVCKIVFQTLIKNNWDFHIHGIGKWYYPDTELLKHLCHTNLTSKCKISDSRYHMTLETCNSKEYLEKLTLSTINEEEQTNQVIRIFQLKGKSISQLSRIDWELPPVEDDDSNIEEILKKIEKIDHIIVQDHNKGTCSEEVMQQLIKKGRVSEASWYIRCKTINPQWFRHFNHTDKIKLFVVGPEVGIQKSPFENWTYENKITIQARDLINECNSYLKQAENIFILTNNKEIIGKVKSKESGSKCIVYKTPRMEFLSFVGWSTSIFSLLSYELLDKSEYILDHDGGSIKKALLTLNDDDVASVKLPEKITLPAFRDDNPKIRIEDWDIVKKGWEDAFKGIGIVDKCFLDVWRARSYLKDYIVCIDEKKKIINGIGQILNNYIKEVHNSSLCILLEAKPGAGKSTLINALVGSFNLHLVRCNITQLLQRQDITDVFDMITSFQAISNKPVLVFVDEVNSKLGNDYVYSSFLTPIEDGIYYKNGKICMIRPCIWIFIQTEIADQHEQGKFEDFKSRMNYSFNINYDALSASLKNKIFSDIFQSHSKRTSINDVVNEVQNFENIDVTLKNLLIKKLRKCTVNNYISQKKSFVTLIDEYISEQVKTENVYFAAHMINQFYPEVTQVSLSVLEYFYKLHDKNKMNHLNSQREIKQKIALLKELKYGKISNSTCVNWDGFDSKVKDKFISLRIE